MTEFLESEILNSNGLITAEDDRPVQAAPEKREAEITPISLYTVVKARDANGDTWKEVADIVNVSSAGGGFYLQRECLVGGLVSLMVPLPAELRCYDHDKELYKVWGVVQHCHKVEAEGGGFMFHVGVAFIGKNAPESYEIDPSQTYRISGMSGDGLWKITETRTPFKKRADARFWNSIDHYLALLDSKMRTIRGERTVTENISKSGAAVFTTLDIEVGDRVKFICERYDFSGIAVVCNRSVSEDSRTRLHLKFVENQFPIELVNLPETVIEDKGTKT